MLNPQFLHVGVRRSFQGIDGRPPEGGTANAQKPQGRQQFILHAFGKGVELRIELGMEQDRPFHNWNIGRDGLRVKREREAARPNRLREKRRKKWWSRGESNP